jgi:hypothetical protein
MASFTTRVELHDAQDNDYTDLHKYMREEGFSRIIESSDGGQRYHLPPGEYNRIDDVTRAAVLEDAKRAAKRTGRDYAILVTESGGRTWSGLEDI